MGIVLCGLNGVGKSSIGRALAEKLNYSFIDNEDLYFPQTDGNYKFSGSRTKEQVIQILEERIEADDRFIFCAVKGDYGDKLLAKTDCIILIEAPKEIRMDRVKKRSAKKFGDGILHGGELADKEKAWFSLVGSRPENYVADWLATVKCPVIKIDGTLPVEENVEYLLSVLKQ